MQVKMELQASWPAYRTATNTEWLYQKLYSYNCPPEDEHIVARNTQRIQICVSQKKLCVKLVTYQNYTKMHGPQNIKILCRNMLENWCLKNTFSAQKVGSTSQFLFAHVATYLIPCPCTIRNKRTVWRLIQSTGLPTQFSWTIKIKNHLQPSG
jgi:hypothetical protein